MSQPRLPEDTVLVEGKPIHLGYSRVKTFQDCPKQYEFSYVKGIRGEANDNMKRGTAYHNTLEIMLEYKRKKNRLAKLGDCLDIAFQFAREEQLKEANCIKVRDAVKFYHEQLYPTHRPILVEGSFEVIRGGVPVTGRIDLIEDDGYITDHKFSANLWPEERAAYGSQPIVYQWAALDIFEKQWPGWVYKGFKYNILRQFPFPVYQEIIIPRVSEEESAWFEEQFRAMVIAIKSGGFPANPTPKGCKYCAHLKLCKPVVYKPTLHLIGTDRQVSID
jgi:PD-(D/E)XK nuclease superfamily